MTAIFAPDISSISRRVGGAGQIGAVAVVRYPGMDTEEVVFRGSAYGTPGPVHVKIAGFSDWLLVFSPERHGQELNEDWIRSYFA